MPIRPIRAVVPLTLVVILAAACGSAVSTPTVSPATSAPPTERSATAGASPTATVPTIISPGTAPPPSPSPSAFNVPLPSLPAADAATYLAAAQAELDLRHQLRDDVGVAELFGSAGPAALAAIDAAEQSFGEASLADFVMQSGLDPASGEVIDQHLAAIAPIPVQAPETTDAWSGSLFGATSFMVSMWLGMAPLAIQQNAGNPKFDQATQQRQETHDSDLGAQTEHLVLTEKVTFGAGQGRVVFDVVMTSAATITDKATGAAVARRTSTSSGRFEVDACPDAQGVGAGRYALANQEEVSRPQGPSNGGASSSEATFRLIDGDDAHLIRTEVEAALATGAHGAHVSADGSLGDPFDWGVGATYPVTIPAQGQPTYGQFRNATAHGATADNFSSLGALLAIADNYLAEAAKAAETFWRSGQCIELKTSEESRSVSPNEQITLTVEPTHRFDRQPVTAPVKAAFQGKESLTPTGQDVNPPASFAFVAGADQGEEGTVLLEQTGRRGIGKKTLDFTVANQDYRGDWSGRRLAGSIQKCGSGAEGLWTLDVVGPGADRAAASYRIPAGADHAPVTIDVPFIIKDSNALLKGTGTFMESATPHFVIKNAEGTFDVALKAVTIPACHR